MSQRYIGLSNHVEHINQCRIAFAEYPRKEWVHHFIHTLEMTPRSWYTSMELRQGNQEWEGLAKKFAHTFEFSDERPTIDVALQEIKEMIFDEIHVDVESFHQCSATIQ